VQGLTPAGGVGEGLEGGGEDRLGDGRLDGVGLGLGGDGVTVEEGEGWWIGTRGRGPLSNWTPEYDPTAMATATTSAPATFRAIRRRARRSMAPGTSR
jgi:hypothetical protein